MGAPRHTDTCSLTFSSVRLQVLASCETVATPGLVAQLYVGRGVYYSMTLWKNQNLNNNPITKWENGNKYLPSLFNTSSSFTIKENRILNLYPIYFLFPQILLTLPKMASSISLRQKSFSGGGRVQVLLLTMTEHCSSLPRTEPRQHMFRTGWMTQILKWLFIIYK